MIFNHFLIRCVNRDAIIPLMTNMKGNYHEKFKQKNK